MQSTGAFWFMVGAICGWAFAVYILDKMYRAVLREAVEEMARQYRDALK